MKIFASIIEGLESNSGPVDAQPVNEWMTIVAKDALHRPLTVLQLKSILFAWHAPSFYGSLIQEIRTDNGQALVVPSEWMWDLLSAQHQMKLVDVSWDPKAIQFMNLIADAEQQLTSEGIQFDAESWQLGAPILGRKNRWERYIFQRWIEKKGTPRDKNIQKRIRLFESMDIEQREHLLSVLNEQSIREVLKLEQLFSNPEVNEQEQKYAQQFLSTSAGEHGWFYSFVHTPISQVQLLENLFLNDLKKNNESYFVPFEDTFRFIQDMQKEFEPFEIRVQPIEQQLVGAEPVTWKVKAQVLTDRESGEAEGRFRISDWLTWHWTIDLNDIEWPRQDWKNWLDTPVHWIRLAERLFQLTNEQVDQLKDVLQGILEPAKRTVADWVQFNLKRQSNPTEQEDIEVRTDDFLQKWFESLIEPLDILSGRPGLQFRGELRAYQQLGVAWLGRMRKHQLGALLADEMGLGKTVQVIAFITQIIENHSPGPILLICPTSVLGNWMKELERFAPELRFIVQHGLDRSRGTDFQQRVQEVDMVLTTYGTSQLDHEDLNLIAWDTLILDEAQQIKNPFTKHAKLLKQLNYKHAITLTGTPIENHISELWSIMDLLNPGYLGHFRSFVKRWKHPSEEELALLRAWLTPFILRRQKKDPLIALNLPARTEIPEHVNLSLHQAAEYEKVVSTCLDRLQFSVGIVRRGLILSTLTKLKQICNFSDPKHPRTPKLDRVIELVREIIENGESVLIFSQFVQTGEVVRNLLEKELHQSIAFLHGGVNRKLRDEMVEPFKNPNLTPPQVMVLSLRAGGFGLNLIGANHVIHVDRWWNPAVEQQASDRVHRIGQEKPVNIYRMISVGTIEERIDQLIREKSDLAANVLATTGEGWLVEQPIETIEKIFKLDNQRATFGELQSFIS